MNFIHKNENENFSDTKTQVSELNNGRVIAGSFGTSTSAIAAAGNPSNQVRIRIIEFYISDFDSTSTQGSYTSSYPLEGVEKQSDGQVGFKFEKADGTALTESELPSSYSLMCHVTMGEGY